MLVYLNSVHSIPLGSVIEIPEMMVLFMEKDDALEDRKIEQQPNSYTYKCIIDEPIHDPLVQVQNDSIYIPNDIGLYPDYETDGIPHDEFMKRITNVVHSKNIFLTEQVLMQIQNIGFAGVWIFDTYKRNIITTKVIKSLVRGEIED